MPQTPPPGTTNAIVSVAQLLEDTAAIWPNFPAVTFADTTQSWADTARHCRNLAAAFQRLGVQRGARVSYLGFNSLTSFELFFAPALIGAILVPINFRLALGEMIECVEDAKPELLVVDDAHLEEARALVRACPALRAIIHAGVGTTPQDMLNYSSLTKTVGTPQREPGAGDDTLVLFYTGGTTGRAKGVMLSHNNLLANARGTAPLYEMRPNEAYLLASPMFHAAAGSRIYTATLMGAHTVIMARFDAGDAISAIETHRINCLQLVPTTVQMILDHPDLDKRDLSSLRMISYGAAPMPVPLLQRTVERFPGIRFFQSYGMTECSPVISILSPADHELTGDYVARLGSVGRPVSYVEIHILDEHNNVVDDGVTGEIVVRGPNVMQGYWQAPELTCTALRDGWYHTGDGGYFNEAGYLVLSGRMKDMIVSGGENIYPIEIENQLCRHPAVRECAVIGVPHEKWGEAVHAIVRLREGHTASEKALIDYCRDHVAHYKCPVGITFRDEPMPLSSVNKVMKSELKKWYAESQLALQQRPQKGNFTT